jgi:hypothetical protein
MASGGINDRDAPYHKAMIDGEMPEILDPLAMPGWIGCRGLRQIIVQRQIEWQTCPTL